jgi:hypothetical protein
MPQALAAFIDALATHIAHERGWSREEALRWIAECIVEAREEYRAIGSPLGDSHAGLLAWLLPRHQPPTA